MSDEIKSGKEVIDDFFAEIYNVKDIDEQTIKMLVALYSKNKLTDTNIQNGLDELLRKETDKIDGDEN